ncbi:MAG: hypothetical protein O2922_05020 [Cyanobacteria bacterium]|nr:hypothetical protein [Cyanobacteriota bacterium]
MPNPAPNSSSVLKELVKKLECCLNQECDIDPLILRLRNLRSRGAWAEVNCLEQELLPLF